MSVQRPMYRLFKYLGTYPVSLWSSVSSSVINKLLDLMPPFLTAWIIDTASGQTPPWLSSWTGSEEAWPVIQFLAILTVLIFGFESLFEWLLKRGFMRLAQQVQHDLRLAAYDKLQKREVAYFENNRTGNLMSILNNDVNQLERFLNNSLNEIIQLIILFVFAGWSLIMVSPLLGLIGMLPIPFIIASSFWYQKRVSPFYWRIRELVGQLSSRLENNIAGMLVIKSFNAEEFEKKRVEKASAEYREANFQAIGWSSIYIPIIRMFIALGFAATLMIGAYWVINDLNGFTFGSLAFFAMMIQRLLWPITRLGRVFDDYERARASARRVFGLVDSDPLIQSPEQAASTPDHPGEIQFKKVSFAYQQGQSVLKNIDLTIPSGQTIGIAGPTGSGKTTLIKLLLRFYDVSQGAILLEGKDIRELDLQSLRSQIALVSQDVYLFHGSIRENIAYGMPDQPMQAIKKAAQEARLHHFIDQLPEQYDTVVGERGIKLSGGQRQRLSIARAILKDAPILILDEATSAVDTETERAIQENLRLLTHGKTAIIVAHRLSTIRHTDTILVLEDGRIVETGSHETLSAQEGIYSELWKVQTGIIF
jgi:ATP-binding cassette subfamily B protein